MPPITFRTKATANNGSIPLEHPAIMLIVPVGAIVVTVALRLVLYSVQLLSPKLGNEPFSCPSACEHCRASSVTNRMSFSATESASVESYGIPCLISSSANPIMPSPILRFARDITSISGNGYRFTSITLSKNRTQSQIASLSRSQSTSPQTEVTNRETLIEPKLQAS